MLLSIIIPVYNAENFIERCINSIIDQVKNIKDIEIVVINDGSTDSSPEIIKKLQIEHPLIKLFNQENSGEGYTRNIGLEKAVGEYIWFIDADDYIEGSILSAIYESILNNKPECILLGFKTVDLKGKVISEVNHDNEILAVNEIISKSIYSNTVWSKVIRSSVISANNLKFNPQVRTATDFDFSFRVLYFSQKVIILNGTCYNYVVNPQSISNIRTKEHLERLANDSVIVGNDISVFLNSNEEKFSGKREIFKPWLDNYLYGLLYSVFRFNYDLDFIKKIINLMKNNNNYPISSNKMGFKQKAFMTIANNQMLFLQACKINRMLKK